MPLSNEPATRIGKADREEVTWRPRSFRGAGLLVSLRPLCIFTIKQSPNSVVLCYLQKTHTHKRPVQYVFNHGDWDNGGSTKSVTSGQFQFFSEGDTVTSASVISHLLIRVSFWAFLSARGDCECADTPAQGHGKDRARRARGRSHAAPEEAAPVGWEPGWKHLCQVLTSGYLKQNDMSMRWPPSSPFHPSALFPWWLRWAFLNEKKKEGPLVVAGWWWETEWEEGATESGGN